ncbi:Hypothetical protein NGAL_HAMBI2605_45990 [Neorhizobium galegae bv. orientalis]|nr:Hypothetical protein NGAL_HAMBI2605_45990 [Neorhizobium galegae bv. orientalis]
MFIGITGHQDRPGISWDWVSQTLTKEIMKLEQPEGAFSSLAAGADQAFAYVSLKLKLPLIAVIPLPGYERCFEGDALKHFHELLSLSQVVQLPAAGDNQQSFYRAGQYIADHSDVLFAVWDGKPSQGFGGTADVVDYARSKSRAVVRINPIDQSILQYQAGA